MRLRDGNSTQGRPFQLRPAQTTPPATCQSCHPPQQAVVPHAISVIRRYPFSSTQLATDPYFVETTFSPDDWLAPTEIMLNDVPCDLDLDLPVLDVATTFDAPTLYAPFWHFQWYLHALIHRCPTDDEITSDTCSSGLAVKLSIGARTAMANRHALECSSECCAASAQGLSQQRALACWMVLMYWHSYCTCVMPAMRGVVLHVTVYASHSHNPPDEPLPTGTPAVRPR